MSNQRLALYWHIADAVILGLAFAWALYGLRGHFWLRGRTG